MVFYYGEVVWWVMLWTSQTLKGDEDFKGAGDLEQTRVLTLELPFELLRQVSHYALGLVRNPRPRGQFMKVDRIQPPTPVSKNSVWVGFVASVYICLACLFGWRCGRGLFTHLDMIRFDQIPRYMGLCPASRSNFLPSVTAHYGIEVWSYVSCQWLAKQGFSIKVPSMQPYVCTQ